MAQEPFTAVAGDRPIHCLHCGSAWFWHRRIVMSSGSATLFGVDAFSPEAAVLSCTGSSARRADLGRRPLAVVRGPMVSRAVYMRTSHHHRPYGDIWVAVTRCRHHPQAAPRHEKRWPWPREAP